VDIKIRELTEEIKTESAFLRDIINSFEKVIVGQKDMIEKVLIGLLSNGHVLIEGVPGLAKTLTVRTLAKSINTDFSRIQFTPDLLPADIIGTLIFDQKTGEFTPKKGPIFANIILADEINRAPAKVQSALLEAMQERQVTIGDTTYKLPEPFLVMATQNPIEQEGTYPLPEAQVDRFMLKIKVGYPDRKEELEIMRRIATHDLPEITPVCNPSDIIKGRELVRKIYMDEKIENYIVDIIMATRKPEIYGIEKLKSLIEYGASPRASIFLNVASRARALISGRGYVTPDDVKSMAYDVLRHRIIITYEAEAEELTAEDIISMIFDYVEVP